MALQIWMPMVSDFNNQGLQNSTITNNSVTLDNNGKLGKCGKFTGSNYISGTINLGDSIEYTLACWVKPPDVSAGNKQIVAIAPNAGWANCRATMFYRQNTAEFIATLSNGTDSLGYTMGMTATPNVWQHIAVTFKNKTMIWYSNGVVQKTLTTTIDPKFSDITAFGIGGASNGAERFTGYINDVRIYDHALSPKEIEILSRGLVCHYPLNGGGRGGDNLLKNSNFLQGTNGMEGYTATGATCTKQSDCMKVVSSGASNGFFTSNFNSITTGAMTTFSAYVKADSTMTIYIGTDGSGNGSCQSYTIGTSWQRISISKEKTTNNANLRIYGQGTFYAKLLKYELGSTITPWIPNSADTAYTAMGYNSTTEYDVSGNGYNGIKNGTMAYSSDTARYSVCTEFSKAGYIINNSFGLTTNAFTLNLWYKPKTATSQHFLLGTFDSWTGNGLGLYRDANKLDVQGVIKTSGTAYQSGVIATTLNTWQMLTYTYDGTNYKGYLNGILKFTKACTGIVSHPVFMIGNSKFNNTAASENEEGFVSDVRLYATALSATQVAELYNTAVSVANNGTLMGYELVEV